jgi:hypothetical protein
VSNPLIPAVTDWHEELYSLMARSISSGMGRGSGSRHLSALSPASREASEGSIPLWVALPFAIIAHEN